jgi:hypothetical protein
MAKVTTRPHPSPGTAVAKVVSHPIESYVESFLAQMSKHSSDGPSTLCLMLKNYTAIRSYVDLQSLSHHLHPAHNLGSSRTAITARMTFEQ